MYLLMYKTGIFEDEKPAAVSESNEILKEHARGVAVGFLKCSSDRVNISWGSNDHGIDLGSALDVTTNPDFRDYVYFTIRPNIPLV